MAHDPATADSDASLPTLSSDVLEAIYQHARETYPEECCGFLLGPRDSTTVDEARRCINEQNRYHALDPEHFPRTARQAYNLGGKDLRFLLESVESPRPVKIIYHSHPDVGAYFSAEDTRAALGREPDATAAPQYPVDHIVIDAQVDYIGGAKLFRWERTQHTFVQAAEYSGKRHTA
ncbi:MAG: Mov34/MPN/PAD-1 family protein [Candidatus Tectomicrobia bacterium]